MKYLKVWTDFENVLSPLKDDEIGRLFLLMIRYARDGVEPTEFVGNEGFIWPAAKRDIDIAMERNEVCRQNGLRGGRPKSKENQTEPNETKENQTEPKESRQDKTRQDMKRQDKTEKRFAPPTLQEVTAYCLERGNYVDPEKFVDFYASKGWKVGNQPMKDWKACVRTWEKRDDRKPDAKPKKVVAQDYEQRDYAQVQDDLIEQQNRRIAERLKQKKVLPAQDFPQRDYSGVNGEMLSDLEREVAEFKREVG